MHVQFLVAILVCLFAASSSEAQPTSFTYQGRLHEGVLAGNGTYDLQFAIFTAASGGSQVGGTLTRAGVIVVSGAFSVELDFGASVFPGAARFLEIRVKKPADPGYTTLTSRVSIGSAPYAIRSANATTVDTSVAGISIVNAVNDLSVVNVINENRLSANLVRIKPAGQQVSAATNANGSDPLLNLRGTYTAFPSSINEMKFTHEGAFVMTGFYRNEGSGTGCAAQIPATGAGTRFMWHPCRGSVRFGNTGIVPTSWNDANIGDLSFAGGNGVTASGSAAFAYGTEVDVSGTTGVGFGTRVTVSGTAGFSAGGDNVCSGFACTAIGFTTVAGGQGSVALGYRTIAGADYSVALGFRAATCDGGTIPSPPSCVGLIERSGSFVWGDESDDLSYVQSQANNEFRIRAKGGVRLRVSDAANGNTPGFSGNIGCDLTAGVPSWTCASSRDVKRSFKSVDGEFVLSQIRNLPLSTFSYIGDTSGIRHMGPVAEDFYEAFSLGDSNKSINAQNMAGVSLAAVKGLEARTAHLQTENDALKEQVTAQQAQLKQQQATIDALMRAVCASNPGAGVCQP
jgi:uncharacterized coiled-coil protein SlyX